MTLDSGLTTQDFLFNHGAHEDHGRKTSRQEALLHAETSRRAKHTETQTKCHPDSAGFTSWRGSWYNDVSVSLPQNRELPSAIANTGKK